MALARPLSLRSSRSSLQEVKVPGQPDGVVAPRRSSCRRRALGGETLLSSNLQRVDLLVTHRPEEI